ALGDFGERASGHRGRVLEVAALEWLDPLSTDPVLVAGGVRDDAAGFTGRSIDHHGGLLTSRGCRGVARPAPPAAWRWDASYTHVTTALQPNRGPIPSPLNLRR